ncbi:MAG: hypothetical protein V1744_02775 [Candidatus Altiarchaeota archaeon]
MRWVVFGLLVLVCGCLQSQTVVQREYVCPDGSVVGSPGKCAISPDTTSTTTVASSTSTLPKSTVTSTTQTTTSSTIPDGCAGLSIYKRAACEAVESGNASMCPFPGLEHSWEPLTKSVFLSLGEDVFDEKKKVLILDVFSGNETCVMEFINRFSSRNDCEGFPYRQLCLEKFIVESNDVKECESIRQGTLQDGCYYALIRLRDNLDACVKYPEYGDCLIKLAAARNDSGLCRRVYQSMSRDDLIPDCIADVKLEMCLQMKDSEEDCCEDVPDELRKTCYIEKLKATNDTFWCKKRVGFEDYEEDWNCYTNTAQKTKDPEVCDLIRPVERRDDCFETMILASGNSTLCGRITDDSKRRDCERIQS